MKKRDSDAFLNRDKFEYLTCLEGGSFQFHRMHSNSLIRITRNKAIYCAVFSKSNPLELQELYEVSPEKMVEVAKDKIEKSRNKYAHVGFSLKEILKIGQKIKLD